MEKRVFVLSPKQSRRSVIAISVWCAAIAGMGLWLSCHDDGFRVWQMILAPMLFWGWWISVFRQTSTLEISDEGLHLTLRRGVGYLLRWDAITSVRLHEHSAAARLWSAVVEDSLGHVVKVPRKCQDSAEIIQILQQRLPDSVFQEW